jgi:hypothetical protein
MEAHMNYYSIEFIRRVVDKYVNKRRAALLLLKLCGKTLQDLHFLFQYSQDGWNFFKKIAGHRLFVELESTPQLLNREALADMVTDMFVERYVTQDTRGEYRCCMAETTYLTKWFSGIMIKSAPVWHGEGYR